MLFEEQNISFLHSFNALQSCPKLQGTWPSPTFYRSLSYCSSCPASVAIPPSQSGSSRLRHSITRTTPGWRYSPFQPPRRWPSPWMASPPTPNTDCGWLRKTSQGRARPVVTLVGLTPSRLHPPLLLRKWQSGRSTRQHREWGGPHCPQTSGTESREVIGYNTRPGMSLCLCRLC